MVSEYRLSPLARLLPSGISLIKISQFLARRLWMTMLWLMRRRWMRQLQAKSTLLLPHFMRASAQSAMKRQNAFARRYGLAWLTCVITFFLSTIALTWTYEAAVVTVESGALNPPARLAGMFVDNQ